MPAPRSVWSSLDVKKNEQALGLCFVLSVAVIWVAASFLVQNLEGRGINAFVLTYIANSLFIILIPVSIFTKAPTAVPTPGGALTSQQSEDKQLLADENTGQQSNSTSQNITAAPAWKQFFNNKQLTSAAFVVAPLWFGAQLAFNFSLSLTNVTSNTILSSTSGLFTYGLSCLLLGEAYTSRKLLSILVCIAGVAMVAFGDSTNSKGSQSLLGDMLCLLSSLFYASYTVAIRKMLPDDHHADVAGLFGLIGLLNLTCMAPLLLLLISMSVVQLQSLTAWLVFLAICKGLFDNVLSDYLWARAVLLTGPTIATVGLSIQIPLAVLAEGSFQQPGWLHNHGSAALMILGALAVILGFLGVTVGTASLEMPHVLPVEDGEMSSPDTVVV